MYSFDKVPLEIKYPTLSVIREFNPFSMKYFPVLRMNDITENPCLKTPYLRILKGHDMYINNKILHPPWSPESKSYLLYSIHKRIFEEKILWMIKYANIELTDEESEFNKILWANRLRPDIEQDNQIVIRVLLESFQNFMNFEGGYEKIKENKFISNLLLFSPRVPIPKDTYNLPFSLKEFVSKKLIENPELNENLIRHSEFNIDNRAEFFPTYSTVPLIDISQRRIFTFKYLELDWFNDYVNESKINKAYKLAYIFPDLYHLWLWRYGIQNLPDKLLSDFTLTYFDNPVFTTNQFPEIERNLDFGDFSIHVVCPNNIYSEDLISELNIDPKKLLTEKLIVTALTNSNKASRARKIEEICPFIEFKKHSLCTHKTFGNLQCRLMDYINWPPRRFERNVLSFQKFLRNEYNHFSKYFYLLFLTLGNNNILDFISESNLYLGSLSKSPKKSVKIIYNDKTQELIWNDPPSDGAEVTIVPWSPFLYSQDWRIDGLLQKIEANTFNLEINNDNTMREILTLFKLFPMTSNIDVLLMKSFDEGPLHIIQNQKKALWNIVKHSHFQEEEETDEDFDLRLMRDKIRDSGKRAGVAIFGDDDVQYLK